VNPFLNFKSFWVYALLVTLLVPSLACTYKPAYLQKGKTAEVSERWRVERINPSTLSPEEKSVFETLGPPQYIRFFRKLSLDRDRVYAWVYTDPVRFISFIDGKKIDYVVVDDDPSPFNEYQRKTMFWAGITTIAAVGLGVLYYYFFVRE